MNKEQLKDEVTGLIAKNKLPKVFDILGSIIKLNRGEIALLNQRYLSVIQAYDKGLIDYSEKQMSVNRIVYAVMELISAEDFGEALGISKDDISISENKEERIRIRYIHYLSGDFYSIDVSNKVKASKLLERIIELVETKHKMILKLKSGEDLRLELFNETKEKILNLDSSIESNMVQENDVIALMIKTKKKKESPNKG